ncbi:hypothetical protein PtB15_11B245 [Puccinia triticina]|nr:hypothetical protein PtB15_11B245 [Puccinia triticina]
MSPRTLRSIPTGPANSFPPGHPENRSKHSSSSADTTNTHTAQNGYPARNGPGQDHARSRNEAAINNLGTPGVLIHHNKAARQNANKDNARKDRRDSVDFATFTGNHRRRQRSSTGHSIRPEIRPTGRRKPRSAWQAVWPRSLGRCTSSSHPD